MVRSEQGMTQTTDQALPERLLRTIRHGKETVPELPRFLQKLITTGTKVLYGEASPEPNQSGMP